MDEDYDFMYEDEETSEPDVDLENQYYNSKAMREDSPKDAIENFSKILVMEPDKGEWGFKALKQIIKLYFIMTDYEKTIENYRVFLSYVKNAVTKNMSEKSINNLLEFISTSQNFEFLEEMYSLTLGCLEENKNERLWFKTNLKLAKLYFDRQEFVKLRNLLRILRSCCQNEDGSDDLKKGTLLLEIYALEIQMYTCTKNIKKLEEYYLKSLTIKSAIPHPKIMGVIRECGGKMYMRKENWMKAQTDFFEAFKNYEEAGSSSRIQCLKYLVLANMMSKSTINPFDSQETKPYKDDLEIIVMNELVSAYQNNDIVKFEQILKTNRDSIMQDNFIRDYVEDLLTNIRTCVLLQLIKPFDSLSLSFVCEKLNISLPEVEDLLVWLIMDGTIQGKIDQVNSKLELVKETDKDEFYKAISKLTLATENVLDSLINQLA